MSNTTTHAAMRSKETSAPSRGSFRPELQGLRALAVGLVLLSHLWPARVSGGFVGVDVFFVISGFLITGHLYKELSSTGTIKVTKFWARRVMRLLPLAFTVLVFSFLAMFFLLPETTWGMNGRQIIASLFYVENWVLAVDSVDYMAADNEPSLVQHYWTLSIEEQFYFVLPLIVLGVYGLAKVLTKKRKLKFTARTLMSAALILVALISFYISITYTNHDPAQAYFVTPTRLWEFAVGGLMALIANPPIVKHWAQNLAGWAGVFMILIAGITYTGDTLFPGYTALLPVIGAGLFIRYGSNNSRTGVYWWASWKPAVRMGDWSYAIYLWHWPLIIIATYVLDDFRWPHKIAIILLTFILSVASQKLVEDPLRHAKYFKTPHRAFSTMAITLVVIFAATTVLPRMYGTEYTGEIAISDCTGAEALLEDCEDKGLEGEPLVPPAQVEHEKSDQAFPECFIPQGKTDFDRSGCSLGADPETAELTIAVFGSSHARMWLPMFHDIGKSNNWNIQGYTKSGCSPVPLSKTSPDATGAEHEDAQACDDFVLNTAEELKNDPDVDVIVTASLGSGGTSYTDSTRVASDQEKVEAIDTMWQQWIDSDKSVITIGEVPHFGDIEAPTCIASNTSEVVDQCSVSYDDAITSRSTFQRTTALEGQSNVAFYDPASGVCSEDTCYSMVGNLITRYDTGHLSEDFAKSYAADFSNFMHKEVLD